MDKKNHRIENEIPINIKEIREEDFPSFLKFLQQYLFPEFNINTLRIIAKNSKEITFKLKLNQHD